jgi:hypothetical protein
VPPVPTTGPAVEARGTIYLQVAAGRVWQALDTGAERFGLIPLANCRYNLPPADMQQTNTGTGFTLGGDRAYLVKGYVGEAIQLPDGGHMRTLGMFYIERLR